MHLFIMLEFTLPDLAGEHPELPVVEFALVVVQHTVGSVTYALLSVLCVDVGGNVHTDDLTSLVIRVTEVQRVNVLDAEDEVVGQRLKEVRLVLESKALLGVAAEYHQGVEGPNNLCGDTRFEGQHKSLRLCHGIRASDRQNLREGRCQVDACSSIRMVLCLVALELLLLRGQVLSIDAGCRLERSRQRSVWVGQ